MIGALREIAGINPDLIHHLAQRTHHVAHRIEHAAFRHLRHLAAEITFGHARHELNGIGRFSTDLSDHPPGNRVTQPGDHGKQAQ